MRQFVHLPFKRKLAWSFLATCAAALILACFAFAAADVVRFRTAMPRKLSVLAQIIADNGKSPLAFNDPKFARETLLASLAAEPRITAGRIFDAEGRLFAEYVRPDQKGQVENAALGPAGHRFHGGVLEVITPIHDGKEVIGTVFLQSDMEELRSDIRMLVLIAVGVLAMSLALALVMTLWLGRGLSGPVEALAGAARRIALEKDFSLRAPKFANDELGALTDSFNGMLAQIQTQDADLRLSRERYEVAVAGARDGLWDWDVGTQRVYFSPQWKRMIGYDDGELENRFEEWESRLHPDDRERVRAALGDYLAGRVPTYEVEFRFRHKDGSYRWVLARGAALRDAQGRPYRMAGSHTDITERKQAEERLAQLNGQLVEASRMAGMAEVATGVLHNVGNVLNSVNVSASLLQDRLAKSRVASLVKTAELLKPHLANPGPFFTSDPKGQLVPDFIVKLARHLADERTVMLEELEALAKNIEHIKRIVAMQQSYARVSGVMETLPPAELVEDAFRLNEGALARHQIKVIRQFAEVPPVQVDRHKVLQILINLIRNARHALNQKTEEQEKILTATIAQSDEGKIQIIIADNGVGIAPENLTRIFQHGFTTKKDGHGFGLHTSANAAREMGGSLGAHSDGLGQGASFTLELPVASIQTHAC